MTIYLKKIMKKKTIKNNKKKQKQKNKKNQKIIRKSD